MQVLCLPREIPRIMPLQYSNIPSQARGFWSVALPREIPEVLGIPLGGEPRSRFFRPSPTFVTPKSQRDVKMAFLSAHCPEGTRILRSGGIATSTSTETSSVGAQAPGNTRGLATNTHTHFFPRRQHKAFSWHGAVSSVSTYTHTREIPGSMASFRSSLPCPLGEVI